MKLTITKNYNNWLTLLEDLTSGKLKLTPAQFIQLSHDAQQWPSCACGQLCATLPRTPKGAPQDPQLYSDGVTFFQAIAMKLWDTALSTFKRIEQRSAQLIELQDRQKAAAARQERERAASKAAADRLDAYYAAIKADQAAAAARLEAARTTRLEALKAEQERQRRNARPYNYNSRY